MKGAKIENNISIDGVHSKNIPGYIPEINTDNNTWGSGIHPKNVYDAGYAIIPNGIIYCVLPIGPEDVCHKIWFENN